MKIMHQGLVTKSIREGQFFAEVQVHYQYLSENWDYSVNPADFKKLERVRAALKSGDIAAAAKEAEVFELHPVAAE